jgi:hypothetical protein
MYDDDGSFCDRCHDYGCIGWVTGECLEDIERRREEEEEEEEEE